ncbi:uncharacterized protein TNCV_1798471 [Trichonephila clavipes]|uniref:Uncharacterized protein n=1 Tax=Trichonephila clavipes TaxID=2585209 RepID=A0A8X6VMU3_TRICX|nr:uncharacterized protein TNCV_1798471 [Trichonephila clavipes]
MTRRKCYIHDFLVESQKLFDKAPTSKDAGLTPLVEGMSDISKLPGHLPNFDCYDGNPRNQGLVGVDGACVNKTLHMTPEEEILAVEVSPGVIRDPPCRAVIPKEVYIDPPRVYDDLQGIHITAAKRLGFHSKRLWMCSWGYSRLSSFQTLPKLIWCGSWECSLGQSLSNHGPHVFYRRKIGRASRPGKQFNLMIDEETFYNACHVWSRIILLKYGCDQALKVRKDNWLQHLGDVALSA